MKRSPVTHRAAARGLRALERAAGAALRVRFERHAHRAELVSRRTLGRILAHNADTPAGERYGFRAILARDDVETTYRSRVPLSTYQDYAEDIERVARGERPGLGASPVSSFAVSSGTTGRPKLVPVTADAQRRMVAHMACMIPYTAAENLRRAGRPAAPLGALDVNLMSMAGVREETDAGIPVGSGSAAGMRAVRDLVPLLWTSPPAVFELEDQTLANYLHALFALRARRVRSVQAIFAPHVVRWLQVLAEAREALVRDLWDGSLRGAPTLPAAVRAELQALLSPEPARAREVERALAAGMDGCLERLWPSLGYVGTCCTGSFALYTDTLRRLAGDVPIYSPTYGASEALIAINLGFDDPNRYVLGPAFGYFEFIPLAQVDADQPETKRAVELTVGEQVEVVLTNTSGFYRYRLGDVVTCVGHHGQAPVLRFDYRRGTQLNVVGEKTSEAQTAQAVHAWASAWLGCRVRDYTTSVDAEASPPRYAFYVELDAALHIGEAELVKGARLLDAALRRANPRYDAYARRMHRLAAPRVTLVRPGGFEALHRALLARSGGQNRNQVKVPRRLRSAALRGVLDGRAQVTAVAPLSVPPPAERPAGQGLLDAAADNDTAGRERTGS